MDHHQTEQTKQIVLYDSFLNKLEEEKNFYKTSNQDSYRFLMASTALDAVKRTTVQMDLSDFVNVTPTAKMVVSKQLKYMKKLNSESLQDTLETLRVVARHTQLAATRSKEANAYVEEVLRKSNKALLKQHTE
ncbi:hypothetical protein [Sporosarcina sp. FA9]|uniref:hypothetical protein n=1 Tax=Sporosarcina sp. FA9 TaxID=3413030 RepID=UPI003F657A54